MSAVRVRTSPGEAILGHALVRMAVGAGSVLVGLVLATAAASAHARVSLAALSGWLGMAAYAAELAASLPLGAAADVREPGTLMAGGAVLSAVALVLFAAAVSLPLWVFSRVLAGAAAAAVTPPLLAVLAGSVQGPIQRARLMSLFELSMLAGLAVGPVLAAELWAQAAHAAFGVCALLCLPAAALLYRGAGAGRGASGGGRAGRQALFPSIRAALRAALTDVSLRRLAPAWLCFNTIIGLWLGPTVTYLLSAPDTRHLQYLDGLFAQRPSTLGWVFLGYAAVFAAGLSGWAIVLGRIGAARVLRVSLAAMLAVSAVLFGLNRCQSCRPQTRAGLVILAALLVMIESGFTPAALSWLAASLRAQRAAGAAMGIYSVLFSVGGALGSLLAGALAQAGGMQALLLGTAALAVIAWLSLPRMTAATVRAVP